MTATPAVYALSATFCFALASLGFTHYARRVSPLWMNAFKATVAFSFFFVAFLVTKDFSHRPHPASLMALILSGLVGLNIGDIFLLKAFSRIGTARTLMIFSFQPLILGFFAYFMFSQTLSPLRMLAVVFMVACVFLTSYERFRSDGRWEFEGPIYALLGVILDSCGILLTRYAFNTDVALTTSEGNFYRCVGAISGFVILAMVKPFHLWTTFKKMPVKTKSVVFGAACLGTFISLSLYLNAVRYGSLATVAAIVGAGPIFAAILESAYQKKWPSIYLYASLCLFIVGFGITIVSS